MTYPDSEVVTTAYNNQMKPTSLVGTDTYLQNLAYDSAGRTRQQVYGVGVFTKEYNYNPWNSNGGRLQSMTAGALQNLAYSYDPVGNIQSITDTLAGPQVQNFTYDSLDRLTSADATGGQNGLYAETYGYDASTGNLASKGGNTYTYGDTSHAHAVTGLSNGNTYAYDADGNQVTRIIGTDTFSLTYDAENRLTTVLKNGQPLASFVYDGDGVQVAATVNGVTTKYVGGIYEVEGANVTKYYLAGMYRVALRVNGVLNYLLQDHLGSTALVTDNLGNVVSEQRYKAWGETRYSSSAANTDYLYTGQKEFSDIGLYFYKARWYDSTLGRFAQADSIVPGAGDPRAWDRYANVSNNPVNFNDPTGHFAWLPVLIIGGALIGAGINYGVQVYNNYQNNGGDLGAAFTKNINVASIGESALAGAAIGLTVSLAAPAIVGLAGDALVGAGLATGSTTLFSVGISAYEGSAVLGAAIFGVPNVTENIKIPLAGDKPSNSPDFIVCPGGNTVIVPKGATGPGVPFNGKGFTYDGGVGGNGLNPRVTGVRIMDPTLPNNTSPGYPNGYVSYYNTSGQTVNPFTGQSNIKPSDPWWHFPFTPQ